ncbi:MAG: MFS transporter [Actinomycetota bacterium]|nr:MFS transporter [Actinomycetota bacterium]
MLAFVGLVIGMLIASISQTIVTTALPAIVDDLGGADRYSWVFSAYLLTSTVSVPIWSGLSDLYGRRQFFIAGIVLFMAGAALAAAAQSMDMMIVARGVQGVGAGALLPLALATVGDLIPARDRPRWQGFMAIAFATSNLLGPTVGGWIVDHATWRVVFLGVLPLGAVALAVVVALVRIPRPDPAGERIDVLGALLLTGALVGLILGTVELGAGLRFANAWVYGPLGTASALFCFLAAHERRAEAPIIPVLLLASPARRMILFAMFLTGLTSWGAIMTVPLFAQSVLDLSATQSGILLTPMMLAMIVTTAGSGVLISRVGAYKWALVTGPPFVAAGFGFMALVTPGTPVVAAIGAVVAVGLGLGLLVINLLTVLQNIVPTRHLGAATGAIELFRGSGGTVGVALIGALLAIGLSGGGVDGASPQEMRKAMLPVFLLAIPVMAVTLTLVLRIPAVPLRHTVHENPEPVRSKS